MNVKDSVPDSNQADKQMDDDEIIYWSREDLFDPIEKDNNADKPAPWMDALELAREHLAQIKPQLANCVLQPAVTVDNGIYYPTVRATAQLGVAELRYEPTAHLHQRHQIMIDSTARKLAEALGRSCFQASFQKRDNHDNPFS